MKKILFPILILFGYITNAQPIHTKTVLNSINDLTNHLAAIPNEMITVLASQTTNRYPKPLTYRHRSDLSPSLHNPPIYVREKMGNGVWESELVNESIIDAAFFDVVPDGTTDITTNLQRAADYCRISDNTNSTPGILDLSHGRTLRLGGNRSGTYVLRNTLYLNCNFDFGGAMVYAPVTGTNVAIWVGPTATNQVSIIGLRGTFPATMYSGMSPYSGGIAIVVSSVAGSKFSYGYVERYGVSVKFLGLNAGHTRNIHSGLYSQQSRHAMWLESTGSDGFCNLNSFIGMTALASSVPSEGTNVLTGYEQIVITTAGSLNANTFFGCSVEGYASARFMVITNGVGNVFRDFRLEQYPGIFPGQEPYWEVISTGSLGHGQDNKVFATVTVGTQAPPVRQHGGAAGNTSSAGHQAHFGQVDADVPGVILEPTRYDAVPLIAAYGLPTGSTGETNALSHRGTYTWAVTPVTVGGKPATASSLRWYQENETGRIRWRNSSSQQKMSIDESVLGARVAGAADDHFTLSSQTARLAWLTSGVDVVGVNSYGDGTLQIAGTHPTIGSNNLSGLTITAEDRGAAVRTLMGYSNLSGDYVQSAFGSFPSNYTEIATVRDWAGGYTTGSGNSQNRGMRFAAIPTNQYIDLLVGPFGHTANPQLRVAYDTVTASNLVALQSLQLDAPTGTLAHVAIFESTPAGGTPKQLKSITLANFRSAAFVGGGGVSVTGGTIAFNGMEGSGVALATNGSNQLVISTDLEAGANVTLSTNGSGKITISSIGGGSGPTNGSAVYVEDVQQTVVNFVANAEIDPNISGTNLSFTLVDESIATNKVDSTFRSFFKDRSTDTGMQTASTISDFADTQWANFTNSMVASNNISIAYDTTNKKLMISSTATGGGGTATNAPTIAVDGVGTTNINLADSAELLVTQTGTNVTYLLAASGATAGSYTNPTLYVDSKGRITNIVSGTGSTSSVGTVDRMWRTIAGVSFVSTNDGGGTYTELDGSSIVYSGVGSNLTISGSTGVGQAVYFNLEFSTPVSHTNYVVLADIESDRAINSGGIFVSAGVDTATGRTTNGVTFAIVSTAGSVNFSLGDRRIRVWVIDPNSLISGEELTSIDASLLTGTIDILRIPSEVATDSEVAASMGAFTNGTGSLTLSNLTITGTLSADSLTVPTNAYSATWATNLTVPTKKDLYDKIETLGTSDPWGNGSFDIVDELMGNSSAATFGENGVNAANNGGSFSTTLDGTRPGLVYARVSSQGAGPTIGWHKSQSIFRLPSVGSTDAFLYSVVLKTPVAASGGGSGDHIISHGFQAYASATNFPPSDFVGFVHCTNFLGSMNWGFQCVSNSTSPGIIDTGVAVTNSAYYTLVTLVSATNAIGWINGVAVVTNDVSAGGIPMDRGVCAIDRFIRTSTNTTTQDLIFDRFRLKYHKP